MSLYHLRHINKHTYIVVQRKRRYTPYTSLKLKHVLIEFITLSVT